MPTIVIQDRRSFRYLQEGGMWTHDPRAAHSFGRVAHAADYCRDAELRDVCIVVGNLGTNGRFDSASKTIFRVSPAGVPAV
jgi:hypothetical protein